MNKVLFNSLSIANQEISKKKKLSYLSRILPSIFKARTGGRGGRGGHGGCGGCVPSGFAGDS